MEESKSRSWTNLATEHSNLRYPVISMDVRSPFNMWKKGQIRFETFVGNEDGSRITLVVEIYHTEPYDRLDDWYKLRDMFNAKCKLIKEQFIFDKGWSILEPYFMNKSKEVMKKEYKVIGKCPLDGRVRPVFVTINNKQEVVVSDGDGGAHWVEGLGFYEQIEIRPTDDNLIDPSRYEFNRGLTGFDF